MRKLIYLALTALLVLGVLPLLPTPTQPAAAQSSSPILVPIGATPNAASVGLSTATASAYLDVANGYIFISVEPNGAVLPTNTVLEGWVVDAGRLGGPGQTNASATDEALGVAFGSDVLAGYIEDAPYALSTGVLAPSESGVWELAFQYPNSDFSAFDAVVITAESDGNALTGFDPRPGTPVFAGEIALGTPTTDAYPRAITIEPMGQAAELALLNASAFPEISGTTQIYSEEGIFSAAIALNGAALPEGSTVQAWLIDAGLETGGPGISNVSDADEAFGVPFGNADFDTLTERSFYALGMGTAVDDGTGVLRLETRLPNYNFSPYDAVLVTVETDASDPRAGSPFLIGLVENAVTVAAANPLPANLPVWMTTPLRNARTGEMFTLADLAADGFTVSVEPMATWCSNCRRQQRTVSQVFSEADPSRYVFISLSVETQLGDERLAQYAANEGFEWVFAVSTNEMLNELINQFGRSVSNPPSTPHFYVYPDGSYSDLSTGFKTVDDFRSALGL